MEKILISACLLGDKCTYNLKDNYRREVEELKKRFLLVPFCPEVEGGLPTPRKPSEQKGSKVIMEDGTDVTRFFNDGAQKALKVCKFHGIRIAILKEKSPSCGTHFVYNGTFSHTIVDGKGVTARLLESYGISCYSEDQISWLLASMDAKESAEKERLAAIKAAKEERAALLKQKEEEEARILEAKKEKAVKAKKDFKKKPFKKNFDKNGEKKSFRKSFHKDGEKKPFRKDGKSFSKGPRKNFSKGPRTYKKSKPE
ncbi:MAG: DUF523 domain-containing protein [Bacilli bacterium]|nr:DUF523 domain-containing protein [Bacilli bacterium]